MGKNKAITELGNILGNIIIHKILTKHTTKPESLCHLRNELIAYTDTALEEAREFNWNDSDVEEMRLEILANFKRNIKRKYPEVKFTMEEVEKIIEEVIEEIIQPTI